MLKNTIFTVLLLLTPIYCQLAIINDPDGYTNVRRKEDIKSEIIGKLFQDEVFHYDPYEATDSWIEIVFKANIDKMPPVQKKFYKTELRLESDTLYLDGYIHKSRLLKIDDLPKLPSKKARYINGVLTLQNDSITFTLKTTTFTKRNHTIKKSKEGWLEKIDGICPMGVDGDLPKVEITSMLLRINGKEIAIPASEYKDLFEPNLKEINMYENERHVIFIYMPFNSDGCGGYDAVWIIKNGKYIKRYVDNSLA